MTNIAWKLIEAMSLQLTPAEREIVLGDLIETRETAWRGLREVSGLVARRQLQLWNGWRPWLAGAGLALPCTFMLMGLSFAIASEFRNLFLDGEMLSISSSVRREFPFLLCQLLVLLICAWSAALTAESVSRRTSALSAICCSLPCLFCLLRFHQESLPRICLMLFLLPAIAGVRFSRRGGTINRRWALASASAATACMTLLAVRRHLWVLDWELIVPTWYLALSSTLGRRIAIPENEKA